MEPISDTTPTPGDDLRQALAGGMSLIGRLLTRGEVQVVSNWMALSADSRALYSRLFVRRDRLVSEAELSERYAEVGSATGALDELTKAGLVWRSSRHSLPVRWLVVLYDRKELARVCRACGLSTRGKRADLESRLVDSGPEARPLLDRSGVRLRHRGLFRRLCRAYLGRSDGDIGALVLHRMGTRRFATYTPTGGAGLFPDRRTLLRYEDSRRWAGAILRSGSIDAAELERALDLIRTAVPTAPEVRKYRSLRYAIRVATLAAEAIERRRSYSEASAIWALLAQTNHASAPGAARRFALCAERDGRPREAVDCLARARTRARDADRLTLERTGRRIARKALLPWRPSAPIRAPNKRTLSLPITPTAGARPLWNGQVIELAVAAALQRAGRTVIPSENLLWTTLFGMLLRDAIFAPVPGMLPGALQVAPLDLGLPAFASRRSHLLGPALAEIRSDHGLARLARAFDQHEGEAIRGVSWEHWGRTELQRILTGLGGPLVASVLEALATGAARTGLPDLVVLAGPSLRIPGLFPATVPATPMFVEVKGPGDSLRDAQRVWLHRLSQTKVHAEVWDIRSAPAVTAPAG